MLSIRISNGARLLMEAIAACQEHGDPLTIRQGELARISNRDLRTVCRWVRELKEAQLIRVVRIRKRPYCRYYIGPRFAAWLKRGLE